MSMESGSAQILDGPNKKEEKKKEKSKKGVDRHAWPVRC